jgi:hypothetical protein
VRTDTIGCLTSPLPLRSLNRQRWMAEGTHSPFGCLTLLPGTLPASAFTRPARCCASLAAGAIASNLAKLHQAKRAFNKYKPQAVFYVDRLDVGRRDLADLNVRPRAVGEMGGGGGVLVPVGDRVHALGVG